MSQPAERSVPATRHRTVCRHCIDSLTLLAFDMYMENREILAESRITEIRNQHAQLARWAQQLEGGNVPTGNDR